jgi:hypothetical protein
MQRLGGHRRRVCSWRGPECEYTRGTMTVLDPLTAPEDFDAGRLRSLPEVRAGWFGQRSNARACCLATTGVVPGDRVAPLSAGVGSWARARAPLRREPRGWPMSGSLWT